MIDPSDISVWFHGDGDLAISPSDGVTGLRRELLLKQISQQFGEGIMGDAEPVLGLDPRCVWVGRAGFEHGVELVERSDRLRRLSDATMTSEGHNSVSRSLQRASWRALDAGINDLLATVAARLNGPDEPDVCPRWSIHAECRYCDPRLFGECRERVPSKASAAANAAGIEWFGVAGDEVEARVRDIVVGGCET